MAHWQERYKEPHWVVTRRTASLVGRVVDKATGAPMPEAVVTITAPPGQTSLDRRVCRPDGSFVFLHLPPGAYEITGSAPQLGGRYGAATLQNVTVPATDKDGGQVREVRLPPTRIRGTVQGTDSGNRLAPVAGAVVRLRGDDAWARTDKDGVFVLSGLAPGRYTLDIGADGFQPAEVKAENLAAGTELLLEPVTLAAIPPA
jgi:hypothetical protein